MTLSNIVCAMMGAVKVEIAQLFDQIGTSGASFIVCLSLGLVSTVWMMLWTHRIRLTTKQQKLEDKSCQSLSSGKPKYKKKKRRRKRKKKAISSYDDSVSDDSEAIDSSLPHSIEKGQKIVSRKQRTHKLPKDQKQATLQLFLLYPELVQIAMEYLRHHVVKTVFNTRYYGEMFIAWDGEHVLLSGSGYHKVQRLRKNGNVTVIAGSICGFRDGVGHNALFDGPRGLVFDKRTRTIIVIDQGNCRLRAIDTKLNVTTIAGNGDGAPVDGPGLESPLGGMSDIALDSKSNVIFINSGDDKQHVVKLSPTKGILKIIADITPNEGKEMNWSCRFAVDANDTIYITYKNCIQRLDSNGGVEVLIGNPDRRGFYASECPAHQALFNDPFGIQFDLHGNLIIVDYGNSCIRMLSADGKRVDLLAGSPVEWEVRDGDALEEARFLHPTEVAIGNHGDIFVCSDYGFVRKITVDY